MVSLAAAVFEELEISVPADPDDTVSKGSQQVQYLDWLRAGCDVAGEHDTVRRTHLWFGEHCLQSGQDSVDVRQDGYSLKHGHHCGMTPARWRIVLLPAKPELSRSIGRRPGGWCPMRRNLRSSAGLG